MKEVVAIIRPEKWLATQQAALGLGLEDMVRLRVLGRGHQQGLRYLRPVAGEKEGGVHFLPKQMMTWLVSDEKVGALIDALVQVNRTGNFGDGKVFVCPGDGVPD